MIMIVDSPEMLSDLSSKLHDAPLDFETFSDKIVNDCVVVSGWRERREAPPHRVKRYLGLIAIAYNTYESFNLMINHCVEMVVRGDRLITIPTLNRCEYSRAANEISFIMNEGLSMRIRVQRLEIEYQPGVVVDSLPYAVATVLIGGRRRRLFGIR
jgi:hypothetical protein